MSAITKLLDSLGEFSGAKLGFGTGSQVVAVAPMLICARIGSQTKIPADSIDVAFISGKPDSQPDGVLWGVTQMPNPPQSAAFVVVETDSMPAKVLNKTEKMPVAYTLPESYGRTFVNAIEDMDFAFLCIKYPELKFPLTIGDAIALQTKVSDFSHHIIVTISQVPTLDDLKILRDMPISGIVADVAQVGWGALSKLRSQVANLEPRKPKTSPLYVDQLGSESEDSDGEYT